MQILSVSRRTDIPAFYSDWFMNRVRAGWCAVPNPFNAKQVARVELDPNKTLLVFWTRWPAPMMRHLTELDTRGYRYYFLVTLVDYPRPLEPRTPAHNKALDAFLRLAERIGPERVIWRYDPIVLSRATGADFHRERFSRISKQLSDATKRAVVSLAEDYPKIRPRLRALAHDHPELVPRPFDIDRDGPLLRDLAAMAAHRGLTITGCAQDVELGRWGLDPGKCIDNRLIQRLFGIQVPAHKDKSQRPACGCVASRDIGMYDSCPFGCVYCYANRGTTLAQRRHAAHDPQAASLIDQPTALMQDDHAFQQIPRQGDLFAERQ